MLNLKIFNDNFVMAYTEDFGYANQAKGAVQQLEKMTDSVLDVEGIFIENTLPHRLKLEFFESDEAFSFAIKEAIDRHFKKHKNQSSPRILILPYAPTDKDPRKNIDMWAKVAKEYYAKNNLGPLLTIAITANLHDYEEIDMVQIPNHTMTEVDEAHYKELQNTNPELYNKIIITEGIIHYMTPDLIKFSGEGEKLQKFIKDNNLNNDKPKVVFALGGTTHDRKIIFDLDVAKGIIEQVSTMLSNGVQVIMTNGPRTLIEVTDYLYEKSLELGFPFVNFKPLAATEEDEGNWIKYKGKYFDVFKKQYEEIGNIYPGILSLPNTAVIHTSDTYAICETASCGVVSASYEIPIDAVARPDCIKLRNLMLEKGYAVDSSELVSVSADEIKGKLNKMAPQIQVVLEKIMNRWMEIVN